MRAAKCCVTRARQGGRQISDQGACAIADALKVNICLRALYLVREGFAMCLVGLYLVGLRF